MRYAVDFDGTISINGKPNNDLINWLRSMQLQGHEVILFTSRTGQRVSEAVSFCAKHGLRFNGVIGGKPLCDYYIDDKAINPRWQT